jgi:hypothetical protein
MVGNPHDRMQQAALLMAMHRHIAIGVRNDREFAEQGVAVMTVRIHRVAAVGELRP